jgi:hypothetical protein
VDEKSVVVDAQDTGVSCGAALGLGLGAFALGVVIGSLVTGSLMTWTMTSSNGAREPAVEKPVRHQPSGELKWHH